MNYRSYMKCFGIKSGRNNKIWAFRVSSTGTIGSSTGTIGSSTGRSLLLVLFGHVLPVEVKFYRYNMFWFSYFDQFFYFCHNFLISYLI